MCLFGRCVLEKLALRFNTFAGGGGGGAPYIKNLEIPKNVIESNIGGEIILYGAAGGAGGSAGGSSGAANEIEVHLHETIILMGDQLQK